MLLVFGFIEMAMVFSCNTFTFKEDEGSGGERVE